MPVALQEGFIHVVMNQPYLLKSLEQANQLLSNYGIIKPFLAVGLSIKEAYDFHVTHVDTVAPVLDELSKISISEHLLSPDQSIIKLVNSLLLEGIEKRASDIHFDEEPLFIQQRHRVDGILLPIRKINRDLWRSIQIRLKVLSMIDITENRLPQDGSFRIKLRGETYDFRLSTIPTLEGESIVVRINQKSEVVPLDELGINQQLTSQLKQIIRAPEGLIIIAGPTGSGKTTTLYALLQELPLSQLNIMALEDPVEHPVQGIRQTNVKPEIGMDFAKGIRAMLRQDPDIMLIGEIRDSESASLALKAALTGHLVLATLHAATVQEIPFRIRDLLGDEKTFMRKVIALISQRLVRKICQSCTGKGCSDCSMTGYYGRQPILELAVNIDGDINSVLKSNNYQNLSSAATELLSKKITDEREIQRILG